MSETQVAETDTSGTHKTEIAENTARVVVECDLPVAEVILLEDRAQVVRRGLVQVDAGDSRLVVSHVAPVISDKTVGVATKADEVSIIDVRVERRQVIAESDKPADARELDAVIKSKEHELVSVEAQRKLLDNESRNLKAVAALTADEIAKDVSFGRTDPERWESELDEVFGTFATVKDELLALESQRADLIDEIQDLKVRRSANQSPRKKWSANLEIDVSAVAETAFEVSIDYIVPGACWRPYHTATLGGDDAGTMEFHCDACVWQNTGEDWMDARLVFSTERASLGAQPPFLTTDLLTTKKKSDSVVVEAREETIHTAGLGAQEKIVMPEVPGIDDGGEARKLTSLEKADVPSDGRPHRVPLFYFEAPVERSLVLMAELAPSVLLKSLQTNQASQPILPGPVDLIRDNGLCGHTSVKFIAPNERFELGWGPDASVRVQRQTKQLTDESKLLSSWTTTPHRVKVLMSNIGPDAKQIVVTERVPVSEIEKVRVLADAQHTTGRKEPSEDGFVEWTVDLVSYGQKTLELAYFVKKHQDVVGL